MILKVRAPSPSRAGLTRSNAPKRASSATLRMTSSTVTGRPSAVTWRFRCAGSRSPPVQRCGRARNRLVAYEQAELVDLLRAREQVSLAAFRERLGRVALNGDAARRAPIGDPAREVAGLDAGGLDHVAGAFEGLEPPGGGRTAVEPPAREQQHRVRGRVRGVASERRPAVLARRAPRHSQVDELALVQQGEVRGVGLQLPPAEAGLDVQHDALAESRGPRGGADRIEGFFALQGFVAVDDVHAREAASEMMFELPGSDAHG